VDDIRAKLKMYVNSTVQLAFKDGEVLIADLDMVLEDENAIVFDLVRSNRPDKYERSDKRPHIFANISDLVRCEPANAPSSQIDS
jgi:small nuclear ribonucleoprotein (snRNP)-like protein